MVSDWVQIAFTGVWDWLQTRVKIGFRLCSNWISTGNMFVNWISWWQKSLVNGKVTKHLPKSQKKTHVDGPADQTHAKNLDWLFEGNKKWYKQYCLVVVLDQLCSISLRVCWSTGPRFVSIRFVSPVRFETIRFEANAGSCLNRFLLHAIPSPVRFKTVRFKTVRYLPVPNRFNSLSAAV